MKVWVYPIIFGKYQLHGEERTGVFDIDQRDYIDSEGTNATQDIAKGAECVIQKFGKIYNTAMNVRTGQAFVFDVGSFYGHNEYDTGNWRAPQHKVSNKAYIKEYKKGFPISNPEEGWQNLQENS